SAAAPYRGLAQSASPFDAPLPDPAGRVETLIVERGHVDAARECVRTRAADFGLDPQRVSDLVLATSEVATNSMRYGGGTARLRVWNDARTMFVEMTDAGSNDAAMAGRIRPVPG